MTNEALLIIDYTNDFVDDKGALTCGKPAQELDDAILLFAGTPLDLILREWKIDTLHLTGVCTDICVLHTAMDAYNRCYNLVVHENGVASFDQTGHKWALNHFKTCLGAEIVK